MSVQSESAKGHAVKSELAYGIAVLSSDEVKADQDTIKRDLGSIDVRIHNNAIQCMIHAEKHGDTSLMRRLLMETVGKDSGYRRQGLIAWMRKYSPMELKGETINLSGKNPETGERRPFRIKEANENPFRGDRQFREVVPFFQQALTSGMSSTIKKFREAVANTQNGQPIDASKPFYQGTGTDKVVDLVEQMERLVAQMPEDNSRDLYNAKKQLRDALGDNPELAREVASEIIGDRKTA